MSGKIFLLRDDDSLASMTEEQYEAESLLQKLLADHPELLAGDQVNPNDPRRWLLVSREVPVPSDAAGSARWSLDHLFIDQDGVPTLVEVKRSTNNQIRREVVGQMLDYAANGSAYWSLEQIAAAFETRCERNDVDSDEVLGNLLGSAGDTAAFWQNVKTNLQAGRIRMLFIADAIPSELKRIIEFLNEQMDPAEVLGVEVKKYSGSDGSVLVPRVVGLTAEAETKKALGPPPQWNRESFVERLVDQRSPEEVVTAERVLDWAVGRDLDVWWGNGRKSGSFSPKLYIGADRYNMFTVYSDGGVPVQFGSMKTAPFDSIAKRRNLADRLGSASEAIQIPDDGLEQWFPLKLHMLTDETTLNGFFAAWDWFIDDIREEAES